MKICFVAPFAYGALTGASGGHIGGVERQTALMARWLADRGHAVSVATWTEGASADEVVDGIRVLKICPAGAGLPALRFVHPRWTALNAALARADADLYYQNCAESVTGQVALWAKRHGRRFVYSIASDPECDPTLPILHSFRERWLYRRGLTLADAIIAQTTHQQQLLKSGFGLTSTALPMPSEVTAQKSIDALEAARPLLPGVVWIGRLMPVKNVALFLDIAERLPDITFHLVGGTDQDTDYAENMLARARTLANMHIHGVLDRAQVLAQIRSSHVLCCTSHHEGFPNTFLEAWAHGVPVVSTVDPDGLLQSRALGRYGTDVHCLAAQLQSLLADSRIRLQMSKNAWDYYYANHYIAGAMPKFESLFMNLLAS